MNPVTTPAAPQTAPSPAPPPAHDDSGPGEGPAGTVREILVEVDQAVSEGDVLLVLDPVGAGDG